MFLTFRENELELVREGLRDYGYTPDNEGLKKFILDCMQDDTGDPSGRPERIAGQINRFVEENPEIVRTAAGLVRSLRRFVR
jgi:hypothetical protein